MTYDETVIRQAVYDSFFEAFVGDEQDPEDIHDADVFCDRVLARLRHIDGGDHDQ